MGRIVVVTPPVASSDRDLDLVRLSEFICQRRHKGEPQGFGLGGTFGYGADYENGVFLMHRYCWCEEESCAWCGETNAPNFSHKGSGLTLHWYKWIGRGMEWSREVDATEWRRIYAECVASVEPA